MALLGVLSTLVCLGQFSAGRVSFQHPNPFSSLILLPIMVDSGKAAMALRLSPQCLGARGRDNIHRP